MIYIQHTCHKRDTFVNGHSSRRRDLEYYSPFTGGKINKITQWTKTKNGQSSRDINLTSGER